MQHMYTVIIPSAKIANVARCVAAIRLHQPDTPIIVVSDGIPVSERTSVPGVRWIEGQAPFCYAANANLGIRAAGCAVNRNRVKRVVRERFRLTQQELPAVDVVVNAKPGAGKASRTELAASIATLLERMTARCARS